MTEKQIELFQHNLEMAIKFHDSNHNDPYGIGNAVKCALLEVKDALGFAIRGMKQPEPRFASNAKTGLELQLHYEQALQSIVNHPQEANNTTEMRLRLIAKDALKSAEKGKER